jgi:thymidylate synthase
MNTFFPAFVSARNIDECYFKLILLCHNHGIDSPVTEGSNKGGRRLNLPIASGIINFPHERPLAPIMPYGVAPVTTDEEIEKYFVEYLMNPEINNNTTEYKYATWINGDFVHSDGRKETQLAWCIRHLKEKGFGNNHCYITVGTPTINFNYDIPYKNETERRTSPCLRGLDIKIYENQVMLGIIYRSWDLYAGFPENMGGFTLLNEYIADQLGVQPGPLTFYSQGMHCYDYQSKSIVKYLRK